MRSKTARSASFSLAIFTSSRSFSNVGLVITPKFLDDSITCLLEDGHHHRPAALYLVNISDHHLDNIVPDHLFQK